MVQVHFTFTRRSLSNLKRQIPSRWIKSFFHHSVAKKSKIIGLWGFCLNVGGTGSNAQNLLSKCKLNVTHLTVFSWPQQDTKERHKYFGQYWDIGPRRLTLLRISIKRHSSSLDIGVRGVRGGDTFKMKRERDWAQLALESQEIYWAIKKYFSSKDSQSKDRAYRNLGAFFNP